MFASKNKKQLKKNVLAKRIFMFSFMILAAAQAAGVIIFAGFSEYAQAADKPIEINTQVPISKNMAKITFDGTIAPIANYVSEIYKYASGAVGILAAVMMMVAGLMWVTAGGNPGKIGEAKEIIVASLSGMVLVLTSYLILNQVNPGLTSFTATEIKDVSKVPVPNTCMWMVGAEEKTRQPGCPPTVAISFAPDKKIDAFRDYTVTGSSMDCGQLPAGYTSANASCCCLSQAGAVKLGDQGIPCANKEKCGVSSNLAEKLQALYKKKDTTQPWRVTGACPPSEGAHISGCHDKCTCVDIALTVENDAGYVQDLAKQIKETMAPSFFQYECIETSDCCSTKFFQLRQDGFKCSDKDTVCGVGVASCEKFKASGPHFHIAQ